MLTKIIVVYASVFGNTKRVAETIGEGMKEIEGTEVVVKKIKDVEPEEVLDYDVILIGSPNHMGGPTRSVKKLIDALGKLGLEGKSLTRLLNSQVFPWSPERLSLRIHTPFLLTRKLAQFVDNGPKSMRLPTVISSSGNEGPAGWAAVTVGSSRSPGRLAAWLASHARRKPVLNCRIMFGPS